MARLAYSTLWKYTFSGFGAFSHVLWSHTHSVLQLGKLRLRLIRRFAPKWLGQVPCIHFPRGRTVTFEARHSNWRGGQAMPWCHSSQAGGEDISSKTSFPKKPRALGLVPATRSSSRQGTKLGSMSKALSLIIKGPPSREGLTTAGSAGSACHQSPVTSQQPWGLRHQLPCLKSHS